MSYLNIMGESNLYALPPDSINTKLTIIKKTAVAHFTRMHSGPRSFEKAN